MDALKVLVDLIGYLWWICPLVYILYKLFDYEFRKRTPDRTSRVPRA